ncbi:hypothetical protein CCM_00934 [Cordyceps militaris CM01]|uniref:Uncharacterized protein n=1 Tax=Cordyceps militaris (strain CM01) TaxID=983644 RepID=G3J7A8_CORMM|nr:uncharacterized protein CCM_00934 [Cordyceps militaris CM01]EGX96278.1 hypothetical protein CCM_00934 [Cordyceps militaris CM01]
MATSDSASQKAILPFGIELQPVATRRVPAATKGPTPLDRALAGVDRLVRVRALRPQVAAAAAAAPEPGAVAGDGGARKKLEFNTLVIALTIALSLNITSSLKANAMDLQWWLLSLRRYKPREADLIMASEHFTTMLQLGWTTRHTLIQISVVVFVTMNIHIVPGSRSQNTRLTCQGSQVALALLGITYNVNPANKFAITRPGLVSIADLSDIQGTKVLSTPQKRQNLTEDVNSRRYSANVFGQVGLGFDEASVDLLPRPGTLYNPDLPQVYYSTSLPADSNDGSSGSSNNTTQETDVDPNAYSYTYVFFESTLANASYSNTVASNRSVTVTASCESFSVLAGGNGLSLNITVRLGAADEEAYLPVANGGSQILYLHDPASQANDTWSEVNAFEPSDTSPWYYVCQVAVGNVTNAVLPQHVMGTNFTRYVPPAIALQGYGSSADGLTNATTNYQFQSYPAQTYFGQPARGSGARMAALVSRCAANAVAASALSNTNIDAPGMTPQRAIQLEITKWRYVHIIVGLTVGVQLLIHLGAVLVANRVQVREQRGLSTASLLRPLLAGVGDRARMAMGKQIAKLIGKGVTVRYEPVGAGFDLCIYRDGTCERFTPDTLDR